MRIIAIIPARGGSKRLQKKNIFPIWGRPMISWAISAAHQSELIDETWVTTEDPEIAAIAKEWGARIHNRDPKLAEDHIYKMEAIRSCYQHIEHHYSADVVISLQANSPQITAPVLDSAIQCFLKNNRNELISVDKNLMQNAAFRIMRPWYVYQRDLSTKTGVYVCDVVDVHTREDVKFIEESYNDRNS